jgi:SAM-dependent methyltransferase
MRDYEPSTYGDSIAEIYDRWYGGMDADVVAERVATLAEGRGPVLELGIGTGRIALPLQTLGVEVHGIDASTAMTDELRKKPGGDRIRLAHGDFADVAVEGRFAVVFVAFNTFFALLTQEDQVRCFRNVATHLAPGGVFALDAFVPDLARFDRHQRVGLEAHDPDAVRLEASRHDPVTQTVVARHVVISEKGTRLHPLRIRYAWPSELDLMARLAGMRLRDRWGGWGGEPFTAESASHVSVYAAGD